MGDMLDGFGYVVGQVGLLLVAAAVLGMLLGRFVWAGRRVRRLTEEVAGLQRSLAERARPAAGGPPSPPPQDGLGLFGNAPPQAFAPAYEPPHAYAAPPAYAPPDRYAPSPAHAAAEHVDLEQRLAWPHDPQARPR